MVFIPAGLKHCPLILKRVDKPIFHFSVVTSGHWDTNSLKETHKPESDYSKYIVTELKAPVFRPEFVEAYKKFATRVLWMDKNVMPGRLPDERFLVLQARPTCASSRTSMKMMKSSGFLAAMRRTRITSMVRWKCGWEMRNSC